MLSPLGGGVDSGAMGGREEQDVSVVGRGAHVEGSLVSTGSLWIAGRVTGEISVEGQVTVAPGSEVEADIKAGSINLAGRVNGNLTAPGSVELPAQSQVKGDVRARSVTLQGAVEGNVVAEQKVELGPSARLQGDITCTALVVAEGAVFRGRSIMAQRPSS
jgi:cytoskeletal protein CcmA (bactofilin family)